MKKIVILLAFIVGLFAFPTKVLAADKRIEVDLSSQRLYAIQDNHRIYEFAISSGKPWWPTPTGTFAPWIKLASDRMTGGNQLAGTYYDLPGVPYVIYFANADIPRSRGFAIHGTYWHSNFGFPMSHGCINLRTSDAQIIYNWIDLTTPIVIYGTTPA